MHIHVCNDNGEPLIQSASGKIIHWYTYRKWASYCWDARRELIYEHHNKIDDPIVLESCTCSICGSSAFGRTYAASLRGE